MSTIIKHCGVAKCKSEFQDKTYGNNLRVMNLQGKSGAVKDKDKSGISNKKYRCTVCGSDSSGGE